MTLRVGFIGLGNQGKPIASHLAPAGFETTVYDVVEGYGTWFIAQELLPGGSLGDILRRDGPLPAEEVRHVLLHVRDRLGQDRDLAGEGADGLDDLRAAVLLLVRG